MKEINLKVNGMVCHGCENRVKNALKNVDGVENVVANHEDGTVKVSTMENVNEKVIEERIEDLGFEIVKEN